MTSYSAQEAVDFIVDRQLISSDYIDELRNEVERFQSGKEVLDDLVQRGRLSAYQKEQILAGQGDKLCFGPYRLVKPLGEGGMGEVFKAWQPRLDRLIALKFILPQYLDKQSIALNRFQREARAIAQLRHPNIIVLYDADEIDGIPFIAMEYVEGVSLAEMVRRTGPLSVKKSCDYMRQAALGLQHAFENGFVHRDIKPSNIMVSQTKKKVGAPVVKQRSLVTMHDLKRLSDCDGSSSSDRIKILDMGLARLNESVVNASVVAAPLTAMGAMVGTPDYVAPEQARDSSKVDIRADLYSLGCTFYFILSGRVPFPGGTALEKVVKHQCDVATPLKTIRRDIPQKVVDIVERLLAKNPEDRFQTPNEVANAITRYLVDPGAKPTPPPPSDTVSESSSESGDSQVPDEPPAESGSNSSIVDSRVFGETTDEASVVLLAPGKIPGLCETMASMGEIDFGQLDNKEVFWESVEVFAGKRVRTAKIKPVATLSGHIGTICGVAVRGNGQLAATADLHGQMRMWDIHDSNPREIDRRHHRAEIQAVALPPDNPKHLYSAELRQGKAVIVRLNWKLDSLIDLADLSTLGQQGIGCMDFTADGATLVAGVGPLAITWQVENGVATNRKVYKGMDQPIRAIAISPDRRMLVASGDDMALRLWQLGAGNWNGKGIRLNTQIPAIHSIRFSPDGSTLAMAGLDNRIVLWPMRGGPDDCARILRGHASNVQHIRFIGDGSQLASVGTDGQFLTWDFQKKAIVRECFLDLALAYRMDMSADGSRLVAGFTSGTVAVYHPSGSI
jgi:serine/threonine-protein kinase